MAQMTGAEIKGALKNGEEAKAEQSFGETVKLKEKRVREEGTPDRKTETNTQDVKRDRGERPWTNLKTENIPSFSALVYECWYAWELESRKEDGGCGVYTSASQLLYLPHGHIKKAQIAFHQHQIRNVFLLTHISSFSIHMI